MKYIFPLFLLALTAPLLSADVVYNVAVSTSLYTGRSGYLDFQLGSGPDSLPASVAVQSFSTDGTLSNTDRQVSGNVTGTLPGAVALSNGQQFNDYFAGFIYGSSLAFTLRFSGPAFNGTAGIASSYGSPFYFGLYDSASTPLGAADPFGNALLIQINSNGTTTPNVYNSAVTLTSAVPEPEGFGLPAVGLAFILLANFAAKAAAARGQSRRHHLLR